MYETPFLPAFRCATPIAAIHLPLHYFQEVPMLLVSLVAAAAIASAVRTSTDQVTPVPNVEALYDAVNDPAKAGATLVLAPGPYVLTKLDQHGMPRLNGGRLELQTDMSITGT